MLASTISLFDGPDWNAQPAAEYACPAGHKRTIIFLRGYHHVHADASAADSVTVVHNPS